jgi:NitT/TauT family transport system substrate-binding protein
MNIRSFRMVPIAVSAIVALLTGCGTVSNTASSPAQAHHEQADITVAALPAADLAGLYIALDQGLFAQQGLRVRIKPIPSSRAIIAAQLQGQVDISAGSYIPYIAAQAAGARFRVLAEASTLRPDTRVLVTRAYSPIVTVTGLAGRTIAVNATNSIGTLLTSVLLSDHGISPAKVRFVTDEQGSAVNFPIDGYVATTAWVQKYPSTAAAFVRAIEAGQLLADTDPGAVQAAIAKYDNLGPSVTTSMALSGYPVGPVSVARIQRVAAAMLEFGFLGRQYAAGVEQGTLIKSMIGSAS